MSRLNKGHGGQVAARIVTEWQTSSSTLAGNQTSKSYFLAILEEKPRGPK